MSKTRKENGNLPGAVMVVGGGVTGVQSALDLANGGYKVYLVEKNASIGGTMAQLDKTFPTNDCSMCILAPKLVEATRHKDIELMPLSELEKLEGTSGNFTATVRTRPRYVDPEACTACTDCEKVCPVAQKDEYEVQLVDRKAIYRAYAQAIPNIYSISKRGTAPCRSACPIDQAAQGYIALIGEGKYREALALIRKQNPLPGVCGRVCHHPCEQNCLRGDIDDPVSIKALKRFVADWEIENEADYSYVDDYEINKNGKKVAVIGSGPAGLTAAHDLGLAGCDVSVFEALPHAGGMLRVGIPSYRLPREVLQREVDFLEKIGVDFTYNTALGKDITIESLKEDGYDAVFLAIGAHRSLKLNIKGEEFEGVIGAVEFLREFNLAGTVKTGTKVAVIGGGNAAIDAARTARRLGADVTIVYRRTRVEMPADDLEIEAAIDEGIKIEFLAAPIEIPGDSNKVTAMRCIRMELGEPDASGRRRPVPIKGSEYDTDYDMVIPSISQEPESEFLKNNPQIKISKWNSIDVDEATGATGQTGVFSAGDGVSGPGMVTEAMGNARLAARGICEYLGIESIIEKPNNLPEVNRDDVPLENHHKAPRQAIPHIDAAGREGSFEEVEQVFSKEQAAAEAQRCLSCGICSECLECVTACKPGAIRHFDKEQVRELNIGSVVLAGGFEAFDAGKKSEYGFGRIPDVVTSMEFERMLSASGPFGGHLQRLSDGREPAKIAWLQCVGSRDSKIGNDYCSSVCCMYATKQAVISKEHSAKVEPTIFFMDNRSHGKDFDRYIERAKNEYGVRYIRCRVDKVDRKDGQLLLRYESERGEFFTEAFDIVVLSVGLSARPEFKRFLAGLGVETDRFGFVESPAFQPVATSREGVYVAGPISGPKDIPESVTEAGAAAAAAGIAASKGRGTMLAEPVFPEERNIQGEVPRVGVFICHCGINIGSIVDVPSVVEYADTLPYVVYNEQNLFTCSQDTQKLMTEKIAEHNLNRVVVASCTPRTHEPLFRATLKESGLNPYLFEMANIREHCSWVHMTEPEEATKKAKELVRMAVARCIDLEPLEDIKLPVTKSSLVIGGGVAGMIAALTLADQGFPTTLVEKEAELGGNLRHMRYTLQGHDTRAYLAQLEERVKGHKNIALYTGTEIATISGFVGNFNAVLNLPDKRHRELETGAVILATGALEAEHKEFGLGEGNRVITQRELEAGLGEGNVPHDAEKIVMVHCVGSRDEEHPYCSRVCCSETVKNALKVKELKPEAEVYCLYRDLRTYGLAETYYRKAREKGVIFARFDPEGKPVVKVNDEESVNVTFFDFIIGDDIEIDADLVVLAEGIWAKADSNKRLAEMLKVPMTTDGFFLEAHMKLRPVDFATEGVFLCGMAHGPKTVEESIAQARAAAARAITVIANDTITAEGRVARVNERMCVGCGTCVTLCPYHAIELVAEKGGVAYVNEGLCKGCGSCAAACWSAAVDVAGVSNKNLLEAITAL
ncbi:MAG: FAD-dependent oxidoreductase [bacterium]|nr:FAD-dependent oxidoreductase [bacterium]